MTKDYSKVVNEIHEQIAKGQERFYHLLEEVTNERNTLDMEKDRLERQLSAKNSELQKAIKRCNELEAMYKAWKDQQHAFDRIVRIGNNMSLQMEQDSRQEKALLNRNIATLQRKLNEESVELTVIIEKIKTRAKTHGINAAGSMFDTVCLLLGDVPAWQKNKDGLERFFANYNEKMNTTDVNNLIIKKVDQMAIGDDATLNHGTLNPQNKKL